MPSIQSHRLPSRRALRSLPAAILAALLAASAAPASATTFVNLPDAELADQAELVASVRVLGWEPGPAGRLPSTRYRVEVEQVHQGEPHFGEIVVHVPGGLSADGLGWQVHGAPEFAEGERAMLFLASRPDGTWGIVQLLLGAFHEVREGGRRLAVRELDGAREIVHEDSSTPPAIGEAVRDYDRFAGWIRARAAGERPEPDYRTERSSGGLERVSEAFEVMTNQAGQCGDGAVRKIRWFRFDTGGSVSWTADPGGQPGMSGGGFAELGNAIAAWNGDGGSAVRYTGGGPGSSGDGQVSFDDPGNEIDGSFTCSGGGVLAIGGPSFTCATQTWKGEAFRRALGAFVVTQDGAGCYFGRSGGKDGEEVFTHELGHTLGLSHSNVPDALMRPTAWGGGRGARLGSDDRAALAFLYGASGSTPPPPPPAPTVPAAPDSLSATALSTSEILLSWRDRSSNESSFRVERLDAFGWSTLGSAAAGSTGATVSGLSPSTTYTFRLRACNDVGCSSPTGSASATTPAAPGGPPAPSLPAAPAGLTATALSTRAVELSWQDRSSDELEFRIEGAAGSGAFVPLGTVGPDVERTTIGDLAPGTAYRFRVRARNAAGSSEWSGVASATTHPAAPDPEPRDECEDDALCLADGRFTVEVTWRDQRTGARGVGVPIEGSDRSGYFWFFNRDNVELVVKVLDGRPVNGHWWFFYGALSDVEYTIEVVDGKTGQRRSYRNEPGEICGRGDTAMLAEVVEAPGSAVLSGAALDAAAAPWEIAEASAVSSGVCAPSSDRLCLADGRFEVRVEWTNQRAAGQSGVGRVSPPATPGTKTGLFWFFDPSNIELVAKMIDGRAVNGHFWFFYGGLSDVDYTLHVRDTVTGKTRSYRNQPGQICGRGDTAAF